MVDLQTALEEDTRLKIAFLRCIMPDSGPTGHVRLFSADQDTIHFLLTEGARVAGRCYRTGESRPLNFILLTLSVNCMATRLVNAVSQPDAASVAPKLLLYNVRINILT